MKRLFWFLKVAVLCTALFVMSGGVATGVVAQDEGMVIEEGGAACKTTAGCKTSSSNTCFCEATNGDCTGCFLPNGGTGCGTCSR